MADLIDREKAFLVLRKAQIASCTCQIKTPDPDWHNHNCRYRILREVEAMIDHLPDAALPAVTLPDDVAGVVEEAGKVLAKLQSQIGDDVQDVYLPEALHKLSADTIRALIALATAQAAQIKTEKEENRWAYIQAALDDNKSDAETALAAMTKERDAALAANRGLVRLNEATEARAERFRSALEEIAEYDTGATAGLAYTARAALEGKA